MNDRDNNQNIKAKTKIITIVLKKATSEVKSLSYSAMQVAGIMKMASIHRRKEIILDIIL